MVSVFTYRCAFYTLRIGGENALFYCPEGSGAAVPIGWPQMEIDGQIVTAAPADLTVRERRFLNDRIEQVTLEGAFGAGLSLEMTVRLCAETPFVRYCYRVSSDTSAVLTKRNGETLVYLSYPAPREAMRTEVRLSEYNALSHGYCLRELPAFAHERELIGPILAETRDGISLLTAYEHGSTYPDLYICFVQTQTGIAVRAVKGNYWDGQPLRTQPLETVWLQLGAVQGDVDALAKAYRAFQLSYCTLNAYTRKPYIFYNTWAFQERNKFYNKQEYLTSMTQERIEREIEIAYRMGVDVFVIDTGWFLKTGDWEADPKRFPKGMRHIHDLLHARGMQLGLWFGPDSAAVSSAILHRHPGAIACTEGETPRPYGVWETEESYKMCMVSDFREDFADRLIELAKTVGVRYFKWDGLGMHECDRAGHAHGGKRTTAQDRYDNYSFQIGRVLSDIADKVCAAVPDAIVDFDVTEYGRYVGLGFLSSGKYFAINNGPYYPNYDIQVPPEQWINIFVEPGPARTWICRQGLSFDKWVPSVLTMAHYLPDDPADSQLINLASLILGQNGIWGDLPQVSEAGIALFRRVLSLYKQVRDDVTRADPVVYGRPGEIFEVHEKICEAAGRGVVSLFANEPGVYRYRMSGTPDMQPVVIGTAVCRHEADGWQVELTADAPTAAILFFGVTEA